MASRTKVLLKDIAKKADVSPALVSFVLNGKAKEYRVGEETEKLIRGIAKEMNYKPNKMAVSLRSGRTGTIGVALSDISNNFFAQVARCIEDVAGPMGYTVFFGSSDEDAAKLHDLISGLLDRGVDGLIVVPCENSETTIKEVVDMGVPTVLIDRFYKNEEISSVSLNNHAAGYSATRHLVSSGYKKVGMVAYDVNLTHMQDRIRGYLDALEDLGLGNQAIVEYLDVNNVHKSACKVINKMLAKGVDALFLATNTISLACLHCFNNLDVDIPGRLGVVGFDGNDAFDLYRSPISYVMQPIEALAKKAVEAVVDGINNNGSSIQRVQIDGELVIRKSSMR